MTKNVITIRPTVSIGEAARLMLEHHISGLPVLDDGGKLVGIVSEGDFLRRSEIGTQRRRPRCYAKLKRRRPNERCVP